VAAWDQQATPIREIDVLWITAGLGCDGDTIAMTGATQPSIEDIVNGGMPWTPKVNLHNPFLSSEVGDEFLQRFHLAAEGKLEPYILVVEGSIPNENNKAEGYWASLGTDAATGQSAERDKILLSSMVSAHAILGVEDGEFISLLEPPAALAEVAAQCSNEGVWPVLAGDGSTTVLSSPIILYDYPQIAPESAGSLFDSTEIDEILSLRILTLTDAEKREMRQSDDRARQILERTENMPDEQFAKLHGVLRGMTSLKEETQ